MVSDRIEGYLLTQEKKDHYRTRLISSIEKSGYREEKTIALNQSGISLDTAARQATEELESRLMQAEQQYRSGKLPVNQYVGIFRKMTDTGQWPSVIVEVAHGTALQKAAANLKGLGFILAENHFDDEKPAEKFSVFNMLHVHIPPSLAFIHGIAAMPFTRHVFDAERKYNRPGPLPGAEMDGSSTPRPLRELVFPDGFPAELETVGQDIKICIIDSGIDAGHPDLKDQIVRIRGFTGEPEQTDVCGHGTHVAGISLGSGKLSHNKYAGISPHSKLLVSKALQDDGSAATQYILAGLRWAYDQGADIVNLSLGGAQGVADGRSILSRACDRLVEKGMVVCVAAGNNGPDQKTVTSPGDSRRAICVGASDGNRIASFSSRGPTDDETYTGPKPDVAAPGVNIVSARSTQCPEYPEMSENPGYTMLSGTSMSSPVVAGMCALFLSYARSRGKSLYVDDLKQILKNSAVSADQGLGIVHGNRAFEALETLLKTKETPRTQAADSFAGFQKVVTFGKYEVIEIIGEGGFGRVYKALDPALHRECALKVPKKHIEADIDKILREPRNQAKLDHPAIIKVHSVEEINNQWCIVMEYAGGGTLRDRLGNGLCLEEQKCLRDILKLAQALQYAHENHLLHYDIKPENIFFDENDNIKLGDFGLSRIVKDNKTKMSVVLGTPPYTGPEQYKGKYDIHSEIWSLGTVFYEMLTGKNCFHYDEGNKDRYKQDIENKNFDPIDDSVSKPVADIVHGMLRSNENKDYQTMADVVADLEPLVNPPPKIKGVLWRAVLLSCFILLTLTSAAYYAEAVHLIDIPGVSFPLTRQQQTTIPEDIRKMDYDLQFKEALKAEKDPETYSLAYRIFDHIEMNSDMPAQREKAGYYKACISFFRLENYHVAIRDFKQFLRTYPESQYVARASLYLGDSYLKINKIDKAISHFQYVYQGFPDNEIRENTHLFLQKAREKLKNHGHDIGFVATSTIGKFLPNNRVGLSLMMLQMMLLIITPIYWRQIFHWLEKGRGSGGTGNFFRSGRKFLWLLVISIVILSIIVLTNYLTHQQIYQNSVDTIEKMYSHFSRWQLQAGSLV